MNGQLISAMIQLSWQHGTLANPRPLRTRRRTRHRLLERVERCSSHPDRPDRLPG